MTCDKESDDLCFVNIQPLRQTCFKVQDIWEHVCSSISQYFTGYLGIRLQQYFTGYLGTRLQQYFTGYLGTRLQQYFTVFHRISGNTSAAVFHSISQGIWEHVCSSISHMLNVSSRSRPCSCHDGIQECGGTAPLFLNFDSRRR